MYYWFMDVGQNILLACILVDLMHQRRLNRELRTTQRRIVNILVRGTIGESKETLHRDLTRIEEE